MKEEEAEETPNHPAGKQQANTLCIPLNETKLNRPAFHLAYEGVNQIPQSPKILREEVRKQIFIKDACGKHITLPTM